jgi:8-oxo-dGTP diphosphatase
VTSVSRYAGVLAFHEGRVVLVREEYPAWGGPFWNVPSGRVERGETPAEGAARELAEETGLVVAPEELVVVSTVTTTAGGDRSRCWNHAVDVGASELRVDDPDGLIDEARWFSRGEAIGLLARLPYLPIAEPAVTFLRGAGSGRQHWTYHL